MKTKIRKIAAAAAAAVLVFTIVLTGTLAWNHVRESALNEGSGEVNPGGRLHDDFDGTNKDIYVENFSDPENDGVPIFARIRLYEYMELGEGAGIKTGEDGTNGATPLVDGTNINEESNWHAHIPTGSAAECALGSSQQIHDFWSWEMGGSTVFLPTFNKNKDSLTADINGTYAGSDKDRTTKEDRYDDYISYPADKTYTQDAVYDADTNNEDEGDAAKNPDNYTTVNESHTTKSTQTSEVLTMEQWIKKGRKPGKFWVYDTDGWAYWAEAIQPGEATGLLLSGIVQTQLPDDSWYYAINAVAQFATAGNWGEDDNTGFYDPEEGPAPTPEALFLLNQAAGRLPSVRSLTLKNGDTALTDGATLYLRANGTLDLSADVSLRYPSGDEAETAVYWTISPDIDRFDFGTFLPTESMALKTYTITATSSLDPNYTASVQVYVYPSDATGVVEGDNGKRYVTYADNTYRKILEDGTLDVFLCAGPDKTIGGDDDLSNVYALEAPDYYGSRFLGPIAENVYLAKGPDGLLGTNDDIKVVGTPEWPQNIQEAKITIEGDTSVYVGNSVQLTATPSPIEDCAISWSLEGTYTDVTLDKNTGLLYVGVNETASTVVVKARTEGMGGVEATHKVTVKQPTVIVSTTVTSTANKDTVAKGMTKQYTATVSPSNPLYKITWSVNGNGKTAIDENGLLSIDFEEELNDTVTVTASVNTLSRGSKTDFVTDKVTIDNRSWYVVVKDGNNVLLLDRTEVRRDLVPADSGTVNNCWSTNTVIRSYFNGEYVFNGTTYLDQLTKLKQKVQRTTIYTRSDYRDSSTSKATSDYVFLLSEADYYGTISGVAALPEEYTYNKAPLPLTTEMKTLINYSYELLRNPKKDNVMSSAAGWWAHRSSTSLMAGSTGTPTTKGFRPAMWADCTVVPD